MALGCERKDLWLEAYTGGPVMVVIIVEHPDDTVATPSPSTPSWRLWLRHSDGGEWQERAIECDTSRFLLSRDSYDFVAYGAQDDEGDDRGGGLALCDDTLLCSSDPCRPLSQVWSGMTSCAVTQADTIRVAVRHRLRPLHIRVLQVDGLQRFAEAKAHLTGLAAGCKIDGTELSPQTLTMEGPMRKTDGGLSGSLMIFGHCPLTVQNHRLLVDLTLRSGRVTTMQWDVTTQLHAGNDPTTITIDSIAIPADNGGAAGGQGICPSLGDWDTVVIELK